MTEDTKFHHGDAPNNAAPIVEMKDIEKHFGNIIALAGVSFDVKPGECHCLLGDNGAGKSTFIKTMSGVHKPTHGEILFEGKTMDFSSPRDAMEAGIATVFQDLAMIPLMSVTRNFFMGREPTIGRGPLKRMDVARMNEITMTEMRQMGINLRAPDQAVGTLSGGERQTVAIARAVHFGAKILILDEPTAGVDIELRHKFWDYVGELNQAGTTILLTTHYLEEAQALCDTIAIINHGRLIACEPTKDLISRLDTKEITVTLDRDIDGIPETLSPYDVDLNDGRDLTFSYPPSKINSGEILTAVQDAGLGIVDIKTREAELEDIFLQLTGNPDPAGK